MGQTVHSQDTSANVVCFGEALLDRLGPLGGNPSTDQPVHDCFGGAPANVACALARLGINVAFVGRLGDDQIGTQFRNLMVERGVDVSGLQIDQKLPSRIVLVRRDIHGERSFAGFAGDRGHGFADGAIDLNRFVEDWPAIASQAKWLLVGTIPLASGSSSKSLLWGLKQASEVGIRIALDVNWRSIFWDPNASAEMAPTDFAKDSIQPLLEIASLLKLSKEEAIWFFDNDNPLAISRSLSHKPDVVVTDGALPVKWLINNCSGTTKVPSSISIIDTTGAGDAFTAGLIFQLLQVRKEENPDSIIRFAAACGALVCSGAGAIDPQPSYEKVKHFLSDSGGKS